MPTDAFVLCPYISPLDSRRITESGALHGREFAISNRPAIGKLSFAGVAEKRERIILSNEKEAAAKYHVALENRSRACSPPYALSSSIFLAATVRISCASSPPPTTSLPPPLPPPPLARAHAEIRGNTRVDSSTSVIEGRESGRVGGCGSRW